MFRLHRDGTEARSYVEIVDFILPLRFQRRYEQLVDPGRVPLLQSEGGNESTFVQFDHLFSRRRAKTPLRADEWNGRGWRPQLQAPYVFRELWVASGKADNP